MAPNCLFFPVSHWFSARTGQLRSACDPQKKKTAYRWIDFLRSTTVHDGSNHSVEVIEGWPRVRRWLFAEQLGVLPQSSVGRCRAVPPLMSRVSITIMMKDTQPTSLRPTGTPTR